MRATFESLPQVERDAILDPRGITKLPAKDINKSESVTVSASNDENSLEEDAPKDAPTDLAEAEVVSPLNIIFILRSSWQVFVSYYYSFLRILRQKDV